MKSSQVERYGATSDSGSTAGSWEHGDFIKARQTAKDRGYMPHRAFSLSGCPMGNGPFKCIPALEYHT